MKAEEEGIRIEYYTLDGEKPEIRMCPGDLMIICNVLHDYAQMLREAAEISGSAARERARADSAVTEGLIPAATTERA